MTSSDVYGKMTSVNEPIHSLLLKCHSIHESLLGLEREAMWLMWPQILAKLTVTMTQLAHLQRDIKSQMSQWIMSPEIQDSSEAIYSLEQQSPFSKLPPYLLLRTKMIPEIEQEDDIVGLKDLHEQCIPKKEHISWIQNFITENILPWNNSIQVVLNQIDDISDDIIRKELTRSKKSKDMFTLEQLIKWQFI